MSPFFILLFFILEWREDGFVWLNNEKLSKILIFFFNFLLSIVCSYLPTRKKPRISTLIFDGTENTNVTPNPFKSSDKKTKWSNTIPNETEIRPDINAGFRGKHRVGGSVQYLRTLDWNHSGPLFVYFISYFFFVFYLNERTCLASLDHRTPFTASFLIFFPTEFRIFDFAIRHSTSVIDRILKILYCQKIKEKHCFFVCFFCRRYLSKYWSKKNDQHMEKHLFFSKKMLFYILKYFDKYP